MSLNDQLLEARAFAGLRRLAEACDPYINLNNFTTPNVQVAPAMREAMTAYEWHILENEETRRLDLELSRIGQNPFFEWLKSGAYVELNENWFTDAATSVWNGAKNAGGAIWDGLGDVTAWVVKQFPYGQKIIDFFKSLTEGGSPIGVLHLVLDLIGVIPGYGNIADAVNASIYFARGMWINGLISLIALMPWGDGAKFVAKIFKGPLEVFGKVVECFIKKDTKAAAAAAKTLAAMKDGGKFIGKFKGMIGEVINAVKTGVAKLVLFFRKFMPATMVKKCEEFLSNNILSPLGNVEKSVSLAEEFIGTKSFDRLAKTDGKLVDKATGKVRRYGEELIDHTADAKKLDIVTKNPTYRVDAAGNATKVADAVTKNAVEIISDVKKTLGKIKPKELDILVKSGDQNVKVFFETVENTPEIMKTLTAAESATVAAIKKDPAIFTTAYKRAKNLNRTLDDIIALAGKSASKKRFSIKISRLIFVLLRNYAKGNWKCLAGGVFGKAAGFVEKASRITGGNISGIKDLMLNEGEDPIDVSNVLPVENKLVHKGTGANATGGDCDQFAVRLKEVQLPNVIQDLTLPDKLGGETSAPTDSTNQERFEDNVNPTLERLGLDPIKREIYQDYQQKPLEERAEMVEVFDEKTMKIRVPVDETEEDKMYEDFIKNEVHKNGESEERVRHVVENQRKKNRIIDNKLNIPSNEPQPETHESFKVMSFKNFIK